MVSRLLIHRGAFPCTWLWNKTCVSKSDPNDLVFCLRAPNPRRSCSLQSRLFWKLRRKVKAERQSWFDERNGWTTCSRAKTSCPRDAPGFLVAGDFRSRNVTCHAEADSNGTRFTVQIPEQVLELEFEVNTYLDAQSLLGNDQQSLVLRLRSPHSFSRVNILYWTWTICCVYLNVSKRIFWTFSQRIALRIVLSFERHKYCDFFKNVG